MELTLNGRPVTVEAAPDSSLLEVLRGPCVLRSMKDGCAPEGSCGACTVIVDGRAVVSCAQPAARFAGRSIETLEGLPTEAREAWADAFVATGASQCGYCSPGVVMKMEALLRRDPAVGLDAEHELRRPQRHARGRGQRLAVGVAILELGGLPSEIINVVVSVLARLAFDFGVWNAGGLHLVLEGDANDYVGKGMAGGKLVIYPPRDSRYPSNETPILGNTCLYGATGGKLYAAGLDVTDPSPRPADSPLWQMNNVIITPHVGGMSNIYREQVMPIVEENIRRFLRGERRNLINYIER